MTISNDSTIADGVKHRSLAGCVAKLAFLIMMTRPGGSFYSVVARNLELQGSISCRVEDCHDLIMDVQTAVLQTVQMDGVCSAAYCITHYN